MVNTLMTLAVAREGKPVSLNVKMTGEELEAALTGGGALVALPTGEDRYTYVNPAHVAMARETTGDEGPLVSAVA